MGYLSIELNFGLNQTDGWHVITAELDFNVKVLTGNDLISPTMVNIYCIF